MHKLSRKETRLRKKLKKDDSTAYVQLESNPLTYDSIHTLLKADRSTRLVGSKVSNGRTIGENLDAILWQYY